MDSFVIPISTMEHQVQGTKQVLTTIKDKDELKKGDKIIFRRGKEYKQWNNIIHLEYCGGEVISVNKKTITLHLYELELQKESEDEKLYGKDYKNYNFLSRYSWKNKKKIPMKKKKDGSYEWFRVELKEVDSSSKLFKNNITKVNDYDLHLIKEGVYYENQYFKWNKKWADKDTFGC
jgi:hypothetical protein